MYTEYAGGGAYDKYYNSGPCGYGKTYSEYNDYSDYSDYYNYSNYSNYSDYRDYINTVTPVSPVGEQTYGGLSGVSFSWRSTSQVMYEFSYRRVSVGAWTSTGWVSSGRASHYIPLSSLILNVKYVWRVRVRNSASSTDYTNSGWTAPQMFVLCRQGIGSFVVRTGNTNTLLRAATDDNTTIKIRYNGVTRVMDTVQVGAENVSRLKTTKGAVGLPWNLPPPGYVNANYVNYSDYADRGHVNYV